MLIRRPDALKSSEITPESLYLNRREWIAAAAGAGLGVVFGTGARSPETGSGMGLSPVSGPRSLVSQQDPVATGTPYGLQKDDKPTPWYDVTHYNNFYEFGTGKEDPAENSQKFVPLPWTVKVDGHVKKPGDYQLEDLLKPSKIEDRIYRHRCVEAWSMVIPWRGIPLSDILKRAEPTSQGKFVEFTTLMDPDRMPGERYPVLPWPYVEGLRLDEAMHPLTLMVTGVYGRALPNQNGAPFRLHVPWKYGFKSIKSIVRIRLVEQMPRNTWAIATPHEYGFYANVNPEVDHPRWSQASERRIGEFARRRTLMFNGYTEQVQSMYSGMDLRKNY